MNIAVLTMTFDCVEVVPFFLRHYETFAGKIIVWDDSSKDGTRELLSNHPLVDLRDWTKESGIHEDVFLQHWQEEYPELRDSFDWVMIPDSDEFLLPMPGRTMRETLNHAELWDVIPAIGFNLVGPCFPKDDGRQIYEINPMGVHAPTYNKPICFKPWADIKWTRGRHKLENCSPWIAPTMLKLLHARYFGRDYTRKRNAKNYERLGDDKGAGWTCAPDYDGFDHQHEGSPEWSEFARTVAFNVV